MKQKHGVAVALIGNTGFIVLDVPINGLDPQDIVEKRELVYIEHKLNCFVCYLRSKSSTVT